MSAKDEAAYDRMEERLADIIGGYLRSTGVAFSEHDDLACANHLLAEAKKEPLTSRLALARALVPEYDAELTTLRADVDRLREALVVFYQADQLRRTGFRPWADWCALKPKLDAAVKYARTALEPKP